MNVTNRLNIPPTLNFRGIPSLFDLNEIAITINNMAREHHGVNLLDNQNYFSLRLTAPMLAVDPSFDLLVKTRGGADYLVEGTEGEMKAANNTTKKITSMRNFTFHVKPILVKPAKKKFLFYVHNNGQVQRIYDIRDEHKVGRINDHLVGLSRKWHSELDAGLRDGDRDTASLPEAFVIDLFKGSPVFSFAPETGLVRTNETCVTANVRENETRIYSDAL